MKYFLPISLLLVLSSSCQQQKAKAHQDAVNDMMNKYGNDQQAKDPSPGTAPSAAVAGSDLMGKWVTVLVTGDTNSNGKLDPEEKEKGSSQYNDYLELNPDGTCIYTQAKIPGRYEIVEKDGNRSIEVIASDGSRVKQGRIISLTASELQLMKFSGGRDIIVYNRP